MSRFLDIPDQNTFLFGPRGTGKSTWLKAKLPPDALWINLLDPDLERLLSAHPGRLRERLLAAPQVQTIVIDEIQKVPALLDVIHGMIEEKRWRFIMTGSSARKLKRAGVNLLAGRAILKTMHPFMAAEMGESFELTRALVRGMLPLVLDAALPEETLNTYVSLYVREEVRAEGLVRRMEDFHRFLEAVSFSHAGLVNASGIARECGVDRKTAQGYVDLLEDLLLAYQLPVFDKRAKRDLVAHRKLFLFDAGVFRALRPKGPFDRPDEISGGALEGLVGQHLRAWIAYRSKENTLYFWRTRLGLEVDFIVYGEDGLWAIEVKAASTLRPKDLRPLSVFREDFPEAKAVLLYGGKDRFLRDGVLCLPCEGFLKSLRPSESLEAAVS